MSKAVINGIEFRKGKGYDKQYKEHYRELKTDISDERFVNIKEYSNLISITPKGNTWIRTMVEVFLKDENRSVAAMYLDRPQKPDNIEAIVKQLRENPKMLDNVNE
jgi:hypothetical protein